MAQLDTDGMLYVDQFEYSLISSHIPGMTGKSSSEAARILLPLLWPMSAEEAGRHKVCFVVNMDSDKKTHIIAK